jgi:hypothetical protein
MDDDIEEFTNLKDGLTGKLGVLDNLYGFIWNAFAQLRLRGLGLWGVYPVNNGMWMAQYKIPLTTDLRFAIGCFHGYINDHSMLLSPLLECKEDVERSLLHYKRDGGVLRFNHHGFKTKFQAPGGVGQDRVAMSERAADYLAATYPEYVSSVYVRNVKGPSYGNTEVRLRRKIPQCASVITLTFGDSAENHPGMKRNGVMVAEGCGFQYDDLRLIQDKVLAMGGVVDIVRLSKDGLPPAFVLVIRDGVALMGGGALDEYTAEHLRLDWDKKALMRGRVVNKNARWNLCYDEEGCAPDYEAGQGRIISFSAIPATMGLYDKMREVFGEKAHNLKIEGNYYYDTSKCGIGFHGDSERRKVIGVRLGESMPIHYQWYQNSKPIGERIDIPLNGGDIYIMSEKAVGTDWKKTTIATLRHATGNNKYTYV